MVNLRNFEILGVCRMISNNYGWDINTTRIIAIVLAIIFPSFVIPSYLITWLLMSL